ncbi:MAG: DUF5011 domain-containing protein [Bacilli bacterium]
MDKKKILATILFLLMSFFMFSKSFPMSNISKNKDESNIIINEEIKKPINSSDKVTRNKRVNTVKDNAPVIVVNPKTIKVVENTNYSLLHGVTVTDDKDYVTILPLGLDSYSLKTGTHNINIYSSPDRSGQTSSASRSVVVLNPNGDEDKDGYTNKEEFIDNKDFDNNKEYPSYSKDPSITINEDNVYFMEVHSSIPLFVASAFDISDGTLPVVITHNINKDILGTYKVVFTAKDILSNITLIEKEFKVIDTTIPIILLNGNNEVIRKGSIYNDKGAKALDNYDGDITSKININNNVLYNLEGNYTVTYDVTDLSSNKASTVSRSVEVTSVDILKDTINKGNVILDNVKGRDISKKLNDLINELKESIKGGNDIIHNTSSTQREIDNHNKVINDIINKINSLEFDVTFSGYGNLKTIVQKVKYGQNAMPPKDIDKKGHTFIKWDKDYTNVVNDINVVALYDQNIYTVHYYNDSTLITQQDIKYGDTPNEPSIIPERISNTKIYKFIGWDKINWNGVKADHSKIVLFSNYDAGITRTYKVTYLSDNKVISEQEVEYGKNSIVPSNPVKESTDNIVYTFKSWDNDGTNIIKDTIINAVYDSTFKTYKVSYYNENSLIMNQYVEHGKDAVPPVNPSKESTNTEVFTFKSWDNNGKNILSNKDIHAIYTSSIRYYKVVFKDYYGNILSEQKVKYNEKVSIPVAPSIVTILSSNGNKTVRRFSGWSQDFNESTLVKCDLVVTAKYKQVSIDSTRIYVLRDGVERPSGGIGLDVTKYKELSRIKNLTIIDYNNEIASAIEASKYASSKEGILALDKQVELYLTPESTTILNSLNTNKYYYQWYVIKYNYEDGWHLDGERMYK